MSNIPFNLPILTGREQAYVDEAVRAGHLSGNGTFTRRCQRWMEAHTGAPKSLLTHSCTAALEMSALLAGIEPGDDVLMPSFTFVSTANAVVLRGATPVFVEIRADTLNIDERLIERSITPRTKAIVVVHYAGVACEMDAIVELAARHRLTVIEDAAQGVAAFYKDQPIGSFGQLAAFSFHETKNVVSGEGGALVVNDPALVERAEIIWEKGTNRSQFFRGQVDKYTWVDVGSSFLPAEIVAAFLLAQLEATGEITARRLEIWRRYHAALEPLERAGVLRRPIVPDHCRHNGHLYYLLFRDLDARTAALSALQAAGVQAVFHYVPLHSSPAGRRFGRSDGDLPVTSLVSDTLLRLPLRPNLTDEEVDRVTEAVFDHAMPGRRTY